MARIVRNLFLADEVAAAETDGNPQEAIKLIRRLLVVVMLLTVFGLTMLYSASYGTAGMKFFRNQLIWVAMGLSGGVGVFVLGYRKVANYSYLWMAMSFILLLVAVAFYPPINGAYRWIKLRLPGFEMSLQPSEFAKIAVAIFIAKYCSDNFRCFNQIRNRHGIVPLTLVTGAVIGAILLGHDLGTTVLVAMMAGATLLAAGLWLRYLIPPLGLLVAGGFYIAFFDAMRRARVTSFLQPEVVQQDDGYQLWNSLLALGSGSWTGIGFMSSRMKAKYLPEAHTDFILAIVGEELGLIAMIGVIVLYAIFTWIAYRISVSSTSRLGMLLGYALTLGISLQAVINIAVVTGSMPTKGMPAPFISYGGSNLMASLIAIGLLASIAADVAFPGYNERYLDAIRRKLSFLPCYRAYRNHGE